MKSDSSLNIHRQNIKIFDDIVGNFYMIDNEEVRETICGKVIKHGYQKQCRRVHVAT